MGFFRSRFNNNSARQLFHSSGVVSDADGEKIGVKRLRVIDVLLVATATQG